MRIHNFRWIAIISPQILGSAKFLTDQYIPCKMFQIFSPQNTLFEISDNYSLSILTSFLFGSGRILFEKQQNLLRQYTLQSIFCTVVGHLASPTTTREKIKNDSKYESFSDVGEIRVWFASKILTPCRMH